MTISVPLRTPSPASSFLLTGYLVFSYLAEALPLAIPLPLHTLTPLLIEILARSLLLHCSPLSCCSLHTLLQRRTQHTGQKHEHQHVFHCYRLFHGIKKAILDVTTYFDEMDAFEIDKKKADRSNTSYKLSLSRRTAQ